MIAGKTVYVMVGCNYFIIGLRHFFMDGDINFKFIEAVDDIDFSHEEVPYVLLVLNTVNVDSLKKFKNAIDFINGINLPVKTGVLVSEFNAYLTYYAFKKIRGKVTFFNSHNLTNGIFRRGFLSWLEGKTFRPARVVYRYRDESYGYSLKEWISLVVPLGGETVKDVSDYLNISEHTLYQIRAKALKKTGLNTYRQFCQLFINGKVRIENNRAPYKIRSINEVLY
ncbi:hypothetical protein D0V11_25020 [Salmonella enterica]|nr:hypothetical protein [Salmonella enterica]EBN7971149.1 hypothetical protein [Salmonella enterica]EJT7259074.1 hypothetical protein [Salmonella enterica]